MRLITKLILALTTMVIISASTIVFYLHNKTGETRIFNGSITAITQEPGLCKFITVNDDTYITIECPKIEGPGSSGTGRDAFKGFYDSNIKVGDSVEVRALDDGRTGDFKSYTLESLNSGTYVKRIVRSSQQ